MADKTEMVIVNGVRYRAEDAPKQSTSKRSKSDDTSADTKARSARNKSG